MSSDPRTLLLAPSDVHRSALRARRLGVHTHDQAVVFMRTDCHVCRSEGLTPHSRVLLSAGERETIATLYQVSNGLVGVDEAGLSEAAWSRLGLSDGDPLFVRHPDPVLSLSSVRARIYGNRLEGTMLRAIMSDVVRGQYSDVHLSAFITAGAAVPFDGDETIALTRAMVEVGDRLAWTNGPILDKHSVGGLPGNRTTPIVVAIVAAHGLTMPKTSSRAITSPAGTADTMETLAPVDLDLPAIRRVVERENGCIVWGGAVRLSPADDILIRVERALDIDSEGQLVASVLSRRSRQAPRASCLMCRSARLRRSGAPRLRRPFPKPCRKSPRCLASKPRSCFPMARSRLAAASAPRSKPTTSWQSFSRRPMGRKICRNARAGWRARFLSSAAGRAKATACLSRWRP